MKKMSSDLYRILLSIFLILLSFLFQEKEMGRLICFLTSYILISCEIYLEAFHHMKEKEFFDENILMILATIGAFVIGQYLEAVVVMLLFEIGEYLSDLAVKRTKNSITSLMDLRSDIIHLKKKNKIVTVATREAKLNDLFEVKPGEVIPLDGIIQKGEGMVDTASLTGESIPRNVKEQDTVLSGFVNLDSVLVIEATSNYETSTASKIIKLMEDSQEKKTKTEKFITKFSKIYTPIVVALAILIVLIPALLGKQIQDSFYHALVFLVMSCPCALVLSTPLGYFQGIGRCSKEGILVKGANELDFLPTIQTIAYDKTGTITKGKFQVVEVKSEKKNLNLLEIAAYCECYSNHPIAKSIVSSYQKEIDEKKVKNFKEFSGKGIEAIYQNQKYYLGNEEFLKEKNIFVKPVSKIGTMIYLATEKEYLGYLVIADELKENVKKTISFFQKRKMNQIILSGDQEEVVASICKEVGIPEYYANLLPQDKVEKVKEFNQLGNTMFVGDGMNDAPVMKEATLGISMGIGGSDIAIDASDIVLMTDDIGKIKDAILISRLTKRIVKQNIFFSIFVKGIVLLSALFGHTSIWLAVFADVGVTLLSVINTFVIRMKKIK